MIVRALASPPTRAGFTQSSSAALVADDLGDVAHAAHTLVDADRHVQLFGQSRRVDDVADGVGLFDGGDVGDLAQHCATCSTTSTSLRAEQL